ncbi:hypothetical protein ABK040_000093 [Willaertia magna]
MQRNFNMNGHTTTNEEDDEDLLLPMDEENKTMKQISGQNGDILHKNYIIDEINKNLLDSNFLNITINQLNNSSEFSDLEMTKQFENACKQRLYELEDKYKQVYFLPDEVYLKVREDYNLLKYEKNTWNLLYSLFDDARKLEKEMKDKNTLLEYYSKSFKNDIWRISHKIVIEDFLMKDEIARKLYVIVKWLEDCAYEKINPENDGTWLYTNRSQKLDRSGIVSELDPDSIFREKKPLESDDIQREIAIIKKTWNLVRSGRMKEAQTFCRNHEQFWRAATLSGSEYYHNPKLLSREDIDNMEEESSGNLNRFVYLNNLISMTKSNILTDEVALFEKSIYGTICGDLDSMLICCETWEDYLWAYCKASLEYRLNETLSKYVPNDTEDKQYVDSVLDFQKQFNREIPDIVKELNNTNVIKVNNESKQPYHLVQLNIINDNIAGLVEYLSQTTTDIAPNLQFLSNFLRFSAHFIILWSKHATVESLPRVEKDIVLYKYVHYLIHTKNYHSIAFYVSLMESDFRQEQFHEELRKFDSRSNIYAESIIAIENAEGEDSEMRNKLISQARLRGLDVSEIAKVIVFKRSREDEKNINIGFNQQQQALKLLRNRNVTELDKKKINSLDWLCIGDIDMLEVIYQSNLLIREFIRQKKLEAFDLLIKKLNDKGITNEDIEITNDKVRTIIKEHLDWKAYHLAIVTFDQWCESIHDRPMVRAVPNPLPSSSKERIQLEKDIDDDKAKLNTWEEQHIELLEKSRIAMERLLDPISPWLVGPKEDKDRQLSDLKQNTIPDIVFCLYKLLISTGREEDYLKCLQLADRVSSSDLELFKFFNKEQIIHFLKLMRDCELRLIESQSQ